MEGRMPYFCKILIIPLLLSFCQASKYDVTFDAYRGTPLTPQQLEEIIKSNRTFWCTNKVQLPCDPNEGSRPDGTCNNLNYPTRGAFHTPNARILPANYNSDFGPRKAKSGEDLPEARHLRTSLMTEGEVPDQTFTHLATYFLIFFWNDAENIHDTENYLTWKPYCCSPEGKNDSMCAPIKVPHDDPVHRFTNVRCMNHTRPITYQNQGCVANRTEPSRLTTTTPFVDLSNVYGHGEGLEKSRLFQYGLLKYEVEDGRIWPPSTKGPNVCYLNEQPHETRCHDAPVPNANGVLGSNIMFIWAWRLHNLIATELHKMNPCWNDEKIFNTARDINIAILSHIAYYEVFTLWMGSKYLLRDGVILASPGFRDLYDEREVPQTYIEFPLAGRWVHTIQPGKLSLYDTNGNYLRQYPEVNLTTRTGWLAVDNNIDYMTIGATRQPLAKIDQTVDTLISQSGFGPLQHAHDLLTYDVTKNRYFGVAPYVKYRDFCSGKTHTSFDDFADVINPDRLEMLRNQYENVEDVDLLAGIWLENKMEGGNVPPTFYCIVIEQLLKNMRMDRHWHERPNRPNAFTFHQLSEIWKSSTARVLCDVGDKVTKVQPKALFREHEGNRAVPCEEIPKINWDAWKDNSCQIQY